MFCAWRQREAHPKVLVLAPDYLTTVATRNWRSEFCISSIDKNDVTGEELG